MRHNVDHPVSLYAASKKSNELMAHAYSHLFRIPCTGLRFFTVYGPWGRPDMALHLFTTAILRGEPIKVFNAGRMRRDFTYIDDIIEGVARILPRPRSGPGLNPAAPNPASAPRPGASTISATTTRWSSTTSSPPWKTPWAANPSKSCCPWQPGDVAATWADIDDLTAATGFAPHTPLREGIARFVAWYREYYRS